MPLEMLETNFKVVMQDEDICVLCKLTLSLSLFFAMSYLLNLYFFFFFCLVNSIIFFSNNLDIKLI
jgi:hypothetical protein